MSATRLESKRARLYMRRTTKRIAGLVVTMSVSSVQRAYAMLATNPNACLPMSGDDLTRAKADL